jgi:hypothetical protein
MPARPKRAELFLASVGFRPAGPRLAATGVGPQFPREPPRSTIRVAAFQTAIEYEYRPLSRTEYRFADHEHDAIRCEALTLSSSYFHLVCQQYGLCLDCILIL